MDGERLDGLLASLRKFGAEATGIEVKSAAGGVPQSVRETVSAFANSPGGGVLLLGVEERDGFVVSGVTDPAKLQADVASLCADVFAPSIHPVITIGTIDGQRVLAIEVPELPKSEKPCYVKSLGLQRGVFVRVGDSDRRLTPEEVNQLVADRGQPIFDRETVPGATTDDLDPRAVRDYVERLRVTNQRLFATEPDDVLLRLTNVTMKNADGNGDGITLAGLLALGRYPQQFFPQLNATFVHYANPAGETTSEGVRFIDNVSVNGPLPTMVAEVLGVLRRNMSRRALIGGVGRRDVWEYPVEALREAVVNALVHRDLSPGSRGMQVQIEMYPDRIRILNPGGLFGPIDLTRLGEEGGSSARNAVLMKILEDVVVPGEDRTVCENRGSGIRNMIAALRHAGMSVPTFKDKVTSFSVEMPNHALLDEDTVAWLNKVGGESLRDSQCIALALLRRGEVLDNAKYRSATAVSDSRVATSELQDLVARELVEQTGTRGGARYTLSDFAASPDLHPRRRLDRRRQILLALVVHGEMSKSELSERLGLNPKTTEHWLRNLKTDGLIEATREGSSKNTRYRVLPGPA